MTFDDFKFNYDLLDGLDAMGFTSPTPIQEQAIPMIMDGDDIIACAQTGTGKTAAFLLPILDRLSYGEHPKGINTIIIAPTRELAQQIDQQIEGLAYFVGVGSVAVYGGAQGNVFDTQKNALIEGADIVVATPGRLIAHLNMGYVDTSNVEHLILDEADRMLDMGFFDDLMKIINKLPKERQTLLFSATMPSKIRELSKMILKPNPKSININMSKPAEGVTQAAYVVHEEQKNRLLISLLRGKEETYPSVILFASTKKGVQDVYRTLLREKFNVAMISSDLEQQEREQVLRNFRSRKTQILVATDVMSRGIDIKEISLVVNYDVPGDAEDYVHRVGRTARADSTGVAITFINERDQPRFGAIETLINMQIFKAPIPSELGEAPLYEPTKKRFLPSKFPPRGKGGAAKGGSKGKSSSSKSGNHAGKPKGTPK
ncbi:MAG: hypothetical protein RI894_1098 [Bacteroidota bacterium]|jgi:superfamily II DNA/RNA helicase